VVTRDGQLIDTSGAMSGGGKVSAYHHHYHHHHPGAFLLVDAEG
jgi:chromosome segregation ATPase